MTTRRRQKRTRLTAARHVVFWGIRFRRHPNADSTSGCGPMKQNDEDTGLRPKHCINYERPSQEMAMCHSLMTTVVFFANAIDAAIDSLATQRMVLVVHNQSADGKCSCPTFRCSHAKALASPRNVLYANNV